MKKLIFIAIASMFVMACNRQPQSKEAAGTVSSKDSLLKQLQSRDSSIMEYIHALSSIQHNIDTLMADAKILKTRGGEKLSDTSSVIAELRAIDALILKNQKSLATLERKLKTSNQKNDDLVDLGEHLSQELNDRDAEIAQMQQTISKTETSLNTLTRQFNDSMNVIVQQRAQIGLMTTKGNTIYYIIGTEKDLVKQGIIKRSGGVVGLGHVPVLSKDFNTSGFTEADLTKLNQIELNGHFVQFVTTHPEKSFKTTSGSPDKVIITDPEDFWSKSKYMVAIIK